jgi:hypothetical protein
MKKLIIISEFDLINRNAMYITIMNSDHLVTRLLLELHTFVLLLFAGICMAL